MPEVEDDAPADGAVEDEALGEGGLKALAAERRARRSAEAEVARLREAGQGRDGERVAELEAELASLRADSFRSKVAAELKIPTQLAGWLAGDSEDSIRENAEAFLAAVGEVYVPRAESHGADDTGIGRRGRVSAKSPHELAAEVMRR